MESGFLPRAAVDFREKTIVQCSHRPWLANTPKADAVILRSAEHDWIFLT